MDEKIKRDRLNAYKTIFPGNERFGHPLGPKPTVSVVIGPSFKRSFIASIVARTPQNVLEIWRKKTGACPWTSSI
tara:strand:+ start:208 stop:432 length:225 start_codon:yes stop_codon:yes gene_type:complete